MRDLYFKNCFTESFNKINKNLKIPYKFKNYDYYNTLKVYKSVKNLNIEFAIDYDKKSLSFFISDKNKGKHIFDSKTINFKSIYKTKINFLKYVYNGLKYTNDFIEKFIVCYGG